MHDGDRRPDEYSVKGRAGFGTIVERRPRSEVTHTKSLRDPTAFAENDDIHLAFYEMERFTLRDMLVWSNIAAACEDDEHLVYRVVQLAVPTNPDATSLAIRRTDPENVEIFGAQHRNRVS
jgi:hypothetical protein